MSHHEHLVGLAHDHRARVHVEPARRQGDVRPHEPEALGLDIDGGSALDRLVDALEADPEAREARQRPAVQAEVEVVLHLLRAVVADLPGAVQAIAAEDMAVALDKL